MQVRELMKQNPVCIVPDSSIKEAAQIMTQVDCGVLPVCESKSDRRPVGVVTDRDIVVRCISEGADPERTMVREALTQDVVTCDEDCTARDAFETMRREKIGRLMVTNERGELVGVISMADIIARVPSEIWNQLPGSREPKARNKLAA